MATTWIKALHKSGGSIASTLDIRIEYAKNFEKTENGALVNSYMCDPFTAQSEFLLSKRLYEQKTGRNQGKHDVIAYHIRMSFKPGEVMAEQALELGQELAMRWTKGKHQFIAAAHTNTKNPHCHIVYNSTNIDVDGKYQDFRHSAIALRRLSDQICLEHGLSVIEKPKLSKGWNRTEYLGGKKSPSNCEKLKQMIDAALQNCKDFAGFLAALTTAGCEVKRGKYIAVKIPSAKKNIRLNSIGDNYTEAAIRERLTGTEIIAPKLENTPSLLIDIQAKLNEGKGAGYENWATLFNLKQSAKTLMFLKEQDVNSYDELVEKSSAVSAEFNERLTKIKAIEKRLNEISELQKQIGTYGKTREVYKQYKASGWNKDFYENHRADITLNRAAKKYFNEMGYGKNRKLPKISELKQEYATLTAEKKKLYSGYKELKEKRTALLTAKANVERQLNIIPDTQKRGNSHEI